MLMIHSFLGYSKIPARNPISGYEIHLHVGFYRYELWRWLSNYLSDTWVDFEFWNQFFSVFSAVTGKPYQNSGLFEILWIGFWHHWLSVGRLCDYALGLDFGAGFEYNCQHVLLKIRFI